MHAIEVDNGIFNATRDTWAPKDDEEDDREQLNILDVFAVEINNWINVFLSKLNNFKIFPKFWGLVQKN